jgi:hypothetical protein
MKGFLPENYKNLKWVFALTGLEVQIPSAAPVKISLPAFGPEGF